MIYLHNPNPGGSDIKDYVVGEPGQSRKYDLPLGQTFGFADEVAQVLIKIFGVKDGESRGLNKGFLEIIENVNGEAVKPHVEETKENDKNVFNCSACGFTHEKKIAVLGHINIKHKNDKVEGKPRFEVNEGIKIVPPAEVDRLRKQRQETASMRPKRSLLDLTPKGEDEVGYRRGVDIDDSSSHIGGDMAKHFYGPGLQEDKA